MKTKLQKQSEAIERNVRWNMLSFNDKVRYLAMRPGKCTKQLAKLARQHNKEVRS